MRYILIPFTLIYFPLTIYIGIFWLQNDGIFSLISFALWQLVIAKVIYDLLWLLIAWFSPEYDIPKSTNLTSSPCVALLYVCRDDVVVECLRDVVKQEYPKYDVYILDDSQIEDNKILIKNISDELRVANSNKMKVELVRRDSLSGYKAGNLNNWLKHYGDDYDYFVIFDSDSKAEYNFIENLVCYAEHPENNRVAIFQSMIHPWNKNNHFVKFVSATAPLLMLLLYKLGNRTGTVISFGHNNLHRINLIKEIGGFNQDFTSEDTVATYELDAIGYKTSLVDVLSYEAEPSNILKYRRRAIRWAGQTAALFKHPWTETSGALKFELSRQLIYYLINIVFFIWLLGSMWYVAGKDSLRDLYNQFVNLFQFYEAPYVISFCVVIALILLHFVVNFQFARKCGVKWFDYLGHIIISLAMYFYTIIPVSIALIKAIMGRRVTFKPSNTSVAANSFSKIFEQMILIWGMGSLSIAQHLWLGVNPWIYLGGWWATMIFFTPVLLYLLQHYPLESK